MTLLGFFDPQKRVLVELPDTAPGSGESSDMHSTSVVHSFILAHILGWNKQNLK